MWLYHRVMIPNDADRMANSVDPDQTVPSFFLGCTGRFVSYLVANPEDMFSGDVAHLVLDWRILFLHPDMTE